MDTGERFMADPIKYRLSAKRDFLRLFAKLSLGMMLRIVLICCCLGAGGCSIVSDLPLDKLPDRSALVQSERMDREGVHKTLGQPHIASRYWGFELFRQADRQTEIPIAVFIPIGRIQDDIYRYTLVSYAQNGVAESAVSGIHRRPSAFRIFSPIEHNYLSSRLEAPGLAFISEWVDRWETVLASAARRDLYLEQARRSSQATVVIGCGMRECSDKLSIDGGPPLPLPCRLKVQNFDQNALDLLQQGGREEYEKKYPTVQVDTVAAIGLAPGNHTLKAWGGRWQQGTFAGLLSGEHSIEFSCRAGEILYIVIDVFAKDYSGWWGAKDIQWNIERYKDMPEIFRDRYLVLYRGDQWLADPEPD
jgi:hypothetical protein